MKKERVRLSKKTVTVWRPQWSEVRGFARNYIRDNKWRYESINDMDDLMQDAYLVFLKVSDSYPRVVEPKLFMSLYKTSLIYFLTDKAREYRRKCDLIQENQDVSTLHEKVPDYSEGPMYALLNAGPPELKMFVALLKDDDKIAKLRTPQREGRGQPRMNFDQRVSKLLGISYFPFRDTIKSILS